MFLRRTQKREITTTIGSLDAKSIMPRAILYRLHKLHKTHTNTPSNDAAHDDDAVIVYCALILCLRRPWHCQKISHTETQYEPIDFPKFVKSPNLDLFTSLMFLVFTVSRRKRTNFPMNWIETRLHANWIVGNVGMTNEFLESRRTRGTTDWVTLRYTCRLFFFRFRSAWATEGNSVSIYIQI